MQKQVADAELRKKVKLRALRSHENLNFDYGKQPIHIPHHPTVKEYFVPKSASSHSKATTKIISASPFDNYGASHSKPQRKIISRRISGGGFSDDSYDTRERVTKPKTFKYNHLTRQAVLRAAPVNTPRWDKAAKPYENPYAKAQGKADNIFWMIYRGVYIKR